MMFLEICKNRGIQARVFPLTFKVDPIMNLMSESYYKFLRYDFRTITTTNLTFFKGQNP